MQVIPTGLPSVYILEPKVFGDSRGWFMETWSERDLERAGLHYRFVQDNQSFQKGDAAQAKIVRCNRGAVLDVAVDLRKGSPTFKKWVSVELSADNKRQLLIPRGFGHAFLTLTDSVEFLYKADRFYTPEADRGIRWNDPEIGIEWGCENPVLSKKDRNAPFLSESDVDFIYE